MISSPLYILVWLIVFLILIAVALRVAGYA
jgi:hypothetical protein